MSWLTSFWKWLTCNKYMEAVKISVRFKKPAQKPEPKVEPNFHPLESWLNDPTTPSLKEVSPAIVPPAQPAFSVNSFAGGGFVQGTNPALAANCWQTIANTLNFYNKHTDNHLKRWAGTSVLNVVPKAGSDLNAFYNRKTMQFFSATHPSIGGTIHTAESADIIAHELGHAILDSYRPDTWSAASLEVWSFHEAFADLTAMMHALSHDKVINHVIRETGGDLRKSNVVSRLAEQMGKAVFTLDPNSGRDPECLRNAVNDFIYVNPAELPKNAPSGKLAAECHSFGRIFLGAFYDILVMIYEDAKRSGDTPANALKHARDQLAQYTLKAIQNAPLNGKFFEAVAKTILWADVIGNARRYHDRMHEIFVDRNIMSPNLMMMSVSGPCPNDEGIVRIQGTMKLRLSDVLISAQSDFNPLYGVELEIPGEQVMLYDDNKQLYDMIRISEDDSLQCAVDMVDYLHDTNSVSDSPETPFEILDGKLVRTHFV